MKNSRRMLAVLVCVVMVLSMAVVASAAASKTFFIKDSGGYQCTGRGTISDNVGTAVFSATALPLQPIIPDDACACTVFVLAHNSSGELMGATTTNGTVYASATYKAPNDIADTYCTFEFNGVDLGGYILYNS